MQVKRRFLIGLLMIFVIGVAPGSARAVYSPTLYEQVKTARDHIQSARARHGTGTVEDAWNKWMEKERELNKDPRHARVIPPGYVEAVNKIKTHKLAGAILLAWDDAVASFDTIFGWLLGRSISSCIRDDIFEIEDILQDVGEEMLRMGILFDDHHYELLKEDFDTLQGSLHYLRAFPEDPELPLDGGGTTRYLFPDGGTNYYHPEGACPSSEFRNAWEDFMDDFEYFLESAQNIKNMNQTGWGSISEMAKKRAKEQAAQWFRKNQISATLGGETGANSISLRKLGGGSVARGIEAAFDVAREEVEKLIGPVVGLVDFIGDWEDKTCAAYNNATRQWGPCNEQQLQCFKSDECDCLNCRPTWFGEEVTPARIIQTHEAYELERLETLARARRGITYQLQYANIAESGVVDFDAALFELSSEIARTYTEDAGKSLPTIIENLSFVENKYCANR